MELKQKISSFLLGWHDRLGSDSPIQTLSELPMRNIVELVFENDHLLQSMLDDYYQTTKNFPQDEGEFLTEFGKMKNADQLAFPFFIKRIQAYTEQKQKEFLGQSVKIVQCRSCPINYFHIGEIPPHYVCRHCLHDGVNYQHTTVKEIPPWVDVENVSWFWSQDDDQ